MPFRKILLPFMLFCLLENIWADEKQTALFISSKPINCTVFVNGIKLDQKTPLLIKNTDSGQQDIRIQKKGFISIEETVQIKSGENNLYFHEMISEKMFSYYKDEEYPNQKYIDSLNIIIPVLAAFSAALTYNEISNPRYSDSLLSPFVVSTYAVNTAFIGTDIAFHLGRKKYREKIKTGSKSENSNTENTDKILYAKAEKSFREGRFHDALEGYREIIRNSRDSALYPYSLYKSAAVLMIEKEYKEASEYFKEITEKYPEADLYDRAFKNLAEIYVINKEYKKAVSSLNNLLYVNSLYKREEIEARIREIIQMEINKE